MDGSLIFSLDIKQYKKNTSLKPNSRLKSIKNPPPGAILTAYGASDVRFRRF